jgi:hypothetical protein
MATNNRAIAIGRFYMVAGEYTERYKIGGKQRLQKIIGKNLLYQSKDGTWFWANSLITKMSIAKLERLTKKIEAA